MSHDISEHDISYFPYLLTKRKVLFVDIVELQISLMNWWITDEPQKLITGSKTSLEKSTNFKMRIWNSQRHEVELFHDKQSRRSNNASVNSSSAHPPRADPREIAFFENELANAPPSGQKKLFKCPGVLGAQKCFISFVSRLSFNKI